MRRHYFVEVMSLEQVFSGRYHFFLPVYQRSYAWQLEHAGGLLTDVVDAMHSGRPFYFLGHLRLANKQGNAEAALIDGQQRVITLTILFALLRDLLPDDQLAARKRLNGLIWHLNGAASPVALVDPQPSIADILRKFVQEEGGTRLAFKGEITGLPPAARSILDNRDGLIARLTDKDVGDKQREAITEFLLTRCAVIVESVEDEKEAWSMLSKEEETGLSFHSSEEMRVSMITAMPLAEQQEAVRLWESEMAHIAGDDVVALLGQIRLMQLKKRSSRPVVPDLIKRFKLQRDGLGFMREVIAPRARHYRQMRDGSLGDGEAAKPVSDALTTLWWIPHQGWVGPALAWLDKHPPGSQATAQFFTLLDRLTWLMRIAAVDPTEQEKRYIALVQAIGQGMSLETLRPLDIEARLQREALKNLRANTYYAKHSCGIVLRRLSRMLDNHHGPVGSKDVTVEHVLPRSVEAGSDWLRKFKNAEAIAEYVNRLGNLVLLTSEHNQEAGNKDFLQKQPILARSNFALSKEAARHDTWDAGIIDRRSEEMIKRLFDSWKLDPAR